MIKGSAQEKNIWTIGHSTRSFDQFIKILHASEIEIVADIRSFPGSRKFPDFNKEALEISLPLNGIAYVHLKQLGGRRLLHPDSKNTSWRHIAFRAYADYMETAEFKEGINNLEEIARKKRLAYMCSEAVWWRCHRSMVSDYLKSRGWNVWHIMGVEKEEEHPYTQPARIVNGKLTYRPEVKQ